MSQRIIAIGDVHGCAEALRALIDTIQIRSNDVLVMLGDYIDRGPNSSGVIEMLLNLKEQCQLISLMGNHELMLLAAMDEPAEMSFWLECGGDTTLQSYGCGLHEIPETHVEFMRNCRPYFETPNHFFVHANYVAEAPLNGQPSYVLFWEHLSHHVPAQHISGKMGIVGHTPQVSGEILDLGHVIGIDTFCVGGRWLTALDVNSGQQWQADRNGRLRESDNEH